MIEPIRPSPLWSLATEKRRVSRAARVFAAVALSTLALAWGGCGRDSQACAWLHAPESFVDAGRTGCTLEPAGDICNRRTGRCERVCEQTEYLVTCHRSGVSGPVTPVEPLQDSPTAGDKGNCRPSRLSGDASPTEVTLCCQCEL